MAPPPTLLNRNLHFFCYLGVEGISNIPLTIIAWIFLKRTFRKFNDTQIKSSNLSFKDLKALL
jgi:uncharacterized membrane-anchored protein YitT (DUF2179 family)